MEGMQLLEIFRLSKTIDLKDGEIRLMGTPVNMVATSVLIDFQKALVESRGFREAYNLIYNSTKKGAFEYNKKFIETHKFNDKRALVEWQWKIVTLAGWGKVTILSIDTTKNTLIAKYEKSPFPRNYGKSNHPVDFIPVGFTAGGVSAGFGADLEGFESKCIAMGDPYCQIEIGPKEVINPKREALWSRLKL